jgi:hypothetical protein
MPESLESVLAPANLVTELLGSGSVLAAGWFAAGRLRT